MSFRELMFLRPSNLALFIMLFNAYFLFGVLFSSPAVEVVFRNFQF